MCLLSWNLSRSGVTFEVVVYTSCRGRDNGSADRPCFDRGLVDGRQGRKRLLTRTPEDEVYNEARAFKNPS